MDWTQALTIIGSTLIPMLAAIGWLIHRMDAGFKEVNDRFKDVNAELKSQGERIARIEGMLHPHEPRIREKK